MADGTRSPWVIDCSFAMALCLPDEDANDVANFFGKAMSTAEQILYVPSLWISETGNVLTSGSKSGRLSQSQQLEALEILKLVRLEIVSIDLDSVMRTVDLAQQFSLSFYDAVYLDLAKQNSAGLATLDKVLLKAAISVDIDVDWQSV